MLGRTRIINYVTYCSILFLNTHVLKKSKKAEDAKHKYFTEKFTQISRLPQPCVVHCSIYKSKKIYKKAKNTP